MIGWPSSGKTLFTIGLANVLERSNIGYIKPLPHDYGLAVDEAMAGRSPKITPGSEPILSKLCMNGRSDLDLLESCISRIEFDTYADDIVAAILKSDAVIFFVKPSFRSDEGTRKGKSRNTPSKEIGGNAAVRIQLEVFSNLIHKALVGWKIRRRTKAIYFVMTKTNPYHFSQQRFLECMSTSAQNAINSLSKRNIPYSFTPMDLVFQGKGIGRRGPTKILDFMMEHLV
jgi:hypothetical protein